MALSPQQYQKLLLTVIHLEVRKGHLRWTVSELSRLTKVSRPLIYYYLGKTKKEIFKAALLILAKEFYGISDERKELKKKGGRLASLKASRELAMGNPNVVSFFYANRMEKNWVQPELLEMEETYVRRVNEDLAELDPGMQVLVKVISHGLVTCPFLTSEDVEQGYHRLNEILALLGYSGSRWRNPG